MPIEATGEEHPLARAGDKLRAAREAMGLDRAELSIRTKINERHLAAIEDSDFAALPARIYAVGFARSYAGAVGLDGPAIAAQVRREVQEQESPSPVRPAYDLDLDDPAKVPSRRLAWIAAALGTALIVAGGVFWRTYFVPAVDLPPVREDRLAATVQAPELTPAALVSPTAESAAGLPSPLDPVPGAQPSAAAQPKPVTLAPPARKAAPSAKPATGVQSLPSPVPDRLEPLPAEAPPPSAPAT